jgi:lipid II:glycine glycyltransferase (peptidoglycan interpeptide bridge formation enzyme)
MQIAPATDQDKSVWNQFVKDNYPPVGAFMQTWEWGTFKEAWGKGVGRYFLREQGRPVAVFMIIEHSLPGGFSYGYVPRGPVIARDYLVSDRLTNLLAELATWFRQEYAHLLFVRFEPPLNEEDLPADQALFSRPDYYVQPRFNHVVELSATEEELLRRFHPSTRSNISRGQKRGVTVELLNHTDRGHYENFRRVAQDTIARNNGKDIYPDDNYFQSLLKSISALGAETPREELTLATFGGYRAGELAAMHFVLFFGDTATYLYGASSTAHLSSKVTTCLHYAAMQEAKRRGLKYYDLGGVDEKLWPSLTSFKRQFRGHELNYLGNLDLPIRPWLYRAYNFAQRLKRSLIK